jgi:opacity protein-like surface antigen
LKYRLFIGLLFGCFSNIYGQSHIQYPQDGVYGGIESGVARVIVDGTFGSDNPKFDDATFISKDYTKSVISVNLGYGKYFGESLIGIEAHYSLYTKKISDSFIQSVFNFDISISSKSEIDLVLGRKIGVRSLLTLRGGIAFSNINISVIDTIGNEVFVLDKKWFGYSLGMGYVYAINDDISIKSKYNLTLIKNNKSPETDAQLVDNRVTLSLIYRIL